MPERELDSLPLIAIENHHRFPETEIIPHNLWHQISTARYVCPQHGVLEANFENGTYAWRYRHSLGLAADLPELSYLVEGYPRSYRLASRVNRLFSPKFPTSPLGIYLLFPDMKTWLILRTGLKPQANKHTSYQERLSEIIEDLRSVRTLPAATSEAVLPAVRSVVASTGSVLYRSHLDPQILIRDTPPPARHSMRRVAAESWLGADWP